MEYSGTSITQTLKCSEQRGVPASEASGILLVGMAILVRLSTTNKSS